MADTSRKLPGLIYGGYEVVRVWRCNRCRNFTFQGNPCRICSNEEGNEMDTEKMKPYSALRLCKVSSEEWVITGKDRAFWNDVCRRFQTEAEETAWKFLDSNFPEISACHPELCATLNEQKRLVEELFAEGGLELVLRILKKPLEEKQKKDELHRKEVDRVNEMVERDLRDAWEGNQNQNQGIQNQNQGVLDVLGEVLSPFLRLV